MAKGKKRTPKKTQEKKVKQVTANTPTRPSTSSTPDLELASGFWKQNWIPGILLMILAIAIYFQSVNFEYVLDDKIVFTDNKFVQEGFSGIKDILTKETFQGYFGEQKDLIVGGRYRPLSLVTFATEVALWGQNKWMSHFINILLYALTALLLFRVLSMMLPEKKSWFFSIAFMASLLFVAHPIHSEVVANVKGRDEILTFLGALLSMYFTLKYIGSDKIYNIILSTFFFFLGLLAKENAITFLAIIPATAYVFTKASFKKIVAVTLPLVLVSIIYLVIRSQVIGYFLDSGKPVTDLMNNPFVEMTGSEKFATIFYTLGLYLKLLIFPHPLTHDYYPYQIPIMNWAKWQSILSLAIYFAMGIYAVWGIYKKHLIAYAVLFYLATLSVVSNIVFPVGTFMNDRFVYISSVSLCLVLAYLCMKILPEKFGKNGQIAGMAIASVFVIGFVLKTIDRVPAWTNALTLNLAAIEHSSNSARANCFMGTALFEEYRSEEDPKVKQILLDKVTYHVDKAIEIYPRYGSALVMQSGVVAEHYKKDRDLDKLLKNFYDLLEKKRNLPFIETYVEYLLDRADSKKLADFCYKTGYELFAVRVKDLNYARKYLNYGITAAPDDRRLRDALASITQ